MREVIDYSKDFLSGETIERKRNKDNVNYRGIATVQLFDEKGNIVQEVKSENMINSKWLSYLYVEFFITKLFYNTVYSTRSSYTPAKNIILTTNSEEESVNDYIKGDLVGWSDALNTYSGNDTFRGTLNTAETIISNFRKHYVIDFPTHAANGTFQSIYWNRGVSLPYFCFKLDKYLGTKSINDTPLYNGFAVLGDYIYGIDYGKKIISKLELKTLKKVKEIDISDTTQSYIDIKIGDAKIYVFFINSAYVYDADLNLVSNLTYTGIDPNGKKEIRVVEAFEDGFMIGEYGSNTGVYVWGLYDFSLTEIREITKLYESRRWYYIGNRCFIDSSISDRDIAYNIFNIDKDDFIIWCKDTWYAVDTNDFKGGFNSLFGYYYDFMKNKAYMGIRHYSNDKELDYFECPKVPWFAHTLLPAPVTKTATNTMKIQYDFIVEERGYFD